MYLGDLPVGKLSFQVGRVAVDPTLSLLGGRDSVSLGRGLASRCAPGTLLAYTRRRATPGAHCSAIAPGAHSTLALGLGAACLGTSKTGRADRPRSDGLVATRRHSRTRSLGARLVS